jgi:hypothetical protein
LLQLFDEAKKPIMKNADFSNPSLPFDRIMGNVIVGHLKSAREASTAISKTNIAEIFSKLTSARWRCGLDRVFVTDRTEECCRLFDQESNKLFPHAIEYFPEQTKKQYTLIRNSIEKVCNQSFVERCIAILLPDLKNEIIGEINELIEQELRAISVAEVSVFPFSNLAVRQKQDGESRLRRLALQIHEDLPESVGFRRSVESLREQINDRVKILEDRRKQEYREFAAAEDKRIKDELEAKYQENLRVMREKNAQRQREREAEREEQAR